MGATHTLTTSDMTLGGGGAKRGDGTPSFGNQEMNGGVIGHGDPNIAKRRDLLNCQWLVYDSNRQAPLGSNESFQRFGRWQTQADG